MSGAGVELHRFRRDLGLVLPRKAVPDRVALKRPLPRGEKVTACTLEGPGCIRRIWVTLRHPHRSVMTNRKVVIRITFDDAAEPHVEAPVGDFFGVMHGVGYYDLNTEFLSAKGWSGYTAFFPMPFARSARVELEAGLEDNQLYMLLDWHRYPGEPLVEPLRFCARWRREMPTPRYGEDFLVADADGPGVFLGYVYGVRLIDNEDRWSHGGSDNIYIDGLGEHPAFIRGIGGEDVFGAGYGGNLHEAESHLYEGMPYYSHEDIGEPRPAPRVVGYRFYVPDLLPFEESIQVRFGCMENDICATAYWYQAAAVRPYSRLPAFELLQPGVPLPHGADNPRLPASGAWFVEGPYANSEREAEAAFLRGGPLPRPLVDSESPLRRESNHGFLDFNHCWRPHARGVGIHYAAHAAVARTVVASERGGRAKVRLAWDDRLILRVNAGPPVDLGDHASFRAAALQVSLRPGPNEVELLLSNTSGTNHGGWCFAFHMVDAEGRTLIPSASTSPPQTR